MSTVGIISQPRVIWLVYVDDEQPGRGNADAGVWPARPPGCDLIEVGSSIMKPMLRERRRVLCVGAGKHRIAKVGVPKRSFKQRRRHAPSIAPQHFGRLLTADLLYLQRAEAAEEFAVFAPARRRRG